MFEQYREIHFVGIGGIGMSGIAEVLKNLNYEITGSDIKESANTERLAKAGIGIQIGHRAENVRNAHVVVVSSAVNGDNPEVLEARKRSIPVIPRAEMLAELGRLKYGILIAGSHGKTTTTSLISTIFSSAGEDPTVVIGGRLIATNSNVMLGKGNFFVAEADESDGSFLKLNPTIAVTTNIDREHLDYFGTLDELKNAFTSFLNKTPFYGQSVLCLEDRNIKDILSKINRRFTTYGFSEEADFYSNNIYTGFMRSEFDLYRHGKFLDRFSVPLSGKHNILNTMASIIVALSIRIDPVTIKESLRNFKGIKRRFELKGEAKGVKVFDDYGHHPTEIAMTLKGIRNELKGRAIVVFQPHRYTRTRDLIEDFGVSFQNADRVYLTDIYAAGEEPIKGISGDVLYNKIKSSGIDVIYFKNKEEIVEELSKDVKKDDIVITFGAGDVWKLGEEFINGPE